MALGFGRGRESGETCVPAAASRIYRTVEWLDRIDRIVEWVDRTCRLKPGYAGGGDLRACRRVPRRARVDHRHRHPVGTQVNHPLFFITYPYTPRCLRLIPFCIAHL